MILYSEPMKIELKGTELYVNGHKHQMHSVRKLQKMQDVLLGKVEPQSEDDFSVYHMYRSVYSNIEMRFDITYLPAKMLGAEFNKTYGHYHPKADDGLAYPELYQVLKGKATFILQEKNQDGSVNVLIVDAAEGEIMLLPPGYGHVTVNPSSAEDLVLSNIVFNGFQSNYDDYERCKGGAYYYTSEGLVQNTNYLVKKFERTTAKELTAKYGITCADLLKDFAADPDQFMFLEKPALLFKK